MSIKLKDGIYCFDFTANGKRFRGSTHTANKREALNFEKEHLVTIRQHKTVKDLIRSSKENLLGDSVELKKGFDEYLKIPKKKTASKQKVNSYRHCWNDFVGFMTDCHQSINLMNRVTQAHAEAYIQEVRTNGRFLDRQKKKHVKNLSSASCNDYLLVCNMVFDKLYNKAELIESPFKHIPKLELKTVGREAFTAEELKLIGEKSKDTWLYPLFLAGISTGLREGDICNLLWSEVDLTTGWITTNQNKTGTEVNIPILPGLRDYLEDQVKVNEYCFPLLAKQYKKNNATIGAAVTEFLESVGIESTIKVEGRDRRVSVKDVHSLRHTFAYMAAVNNIPMDIVQSILGHSTATMTAMYTNHATQQAKEQAVKLLPDMFNPGAVVVESETDKILAKVESMTEKTWKAIRRQILRDYK